MSMLLPRDDNGNTIPTLGYDFRGCHTVAVGETSTRNDVPIREGVRFVSIVATGPCRFEIGDSDVTAVPSISPILFAGQYLDMPLAPDQRHVAFVAEDEDCTAYIIGRI